MTRPLRAIVADDEPPARNRIVKLLESVPEVVVQAQCTHGEDAVKAVRRHSPDLVFLDVQMPRLDGFEVVQTLGPALMPPVIFVTAYDRYALRAFDVHAVDYLLKPYSRERFMEALARALREVQHRRGGITHNLDALLGQLREDGRLVDRILVPNRHRVDLVRVADIDWIESAGNYVVLHTGKSKHLLRESMLGIGRRLPAGRFARMHRGCWVNLDRIDHLTRLDSGDFEVHLKGGPVLPGSRRYAAAAFSLWRP